MGKSTVHPIEPDQINRENDQGSTPGSGHVNADAFAAVPLTAVKENSLEEVVEEKEKDVPDQSPEHQLQPEPLPEEPEPTHKESLASEKAAENSETMTLPVESIDANKDDPVPQQWDFTSERSGEFTSSKKVKPIGTVNALLSATWLEINQTNRDKEDFANVLNQYEVRDMNQPPVRRKIFQGAEETISELRCRVSTSTNRSQPFTIVVYEVDTGDAVLKIERNGMNEELTRVYKFINKTKVEQVGMIIPDTRWSVVRPTFTVLDNGGSLAMRIIGPVFPLQFCNNSQSSISIFEVSEGDGKEILAKITKDGDLYILDEMEKVDLSNDVTLTINFERKDVELQRKVLIMAATFMLDYTYYSEPGFCTKFSSLIRRCFGSQE